MQIVLDSTPFYGESGGQIGDRGVLAGGVPWAGAEAGVIVRIEAVSHQRKLIVHHGRIERGELALGDTVTALVDRACRRRVQAHHTATHLLQAALKQLVDPSIAQAGSLVDFERLRFDFHCPRAISPEDLERIEERINGWIADAHALEVREMELERARSAGAVAMFGEKYADTVRVVDVPGVSMELCGGTHVANTAEIGLFRIVSESGVAAGIRRIEAVAGPAVLDYLKERDTVVRALGDRFKVQPGEILERVSGLQEELRASVQGAGGGPLRAGPGPGLGPGCRRPGGGRVPGAGGTAGWGGGCRPADGRPAASGRPGPWRGGGAGRAAGPCGSGQGDPGGGLRRRGDRCRAEGRQLHRRRGEALRRRRRWSPPAGPGGRARWRRPRPGPGAGPR